MAAPPPRPVARLFPRGSWPEVARIGEILRAETVGGALLVGAAILALIWANSPWSAAYTAVSEFRVGPAALHLDLTSAQWAADGLLAIFFFVAGLELKREFVAGDLRNSRLAVLPVAAAVGGMVLPAAAFVAVNTRAGGLRRLGDPDRDRHRLRPGRARRRRHSPTDRAAHVPADPGRRRRPPRHHDHRALLHRGTTRAPLLLAALPLAVFAVLVQRRVRSWWLLLPLALATWVLVHASGVHATVAGVLLGFAVPVRRRATGPGPGLAEHLEHRFRPLSAGVAVPVFAFFAAGVPLADTCGLGPVVAGPITAGIIVGLVVGKPLGVLGATWVVQRFTRAQLAPDLSWWDVVGLALLAGIGFTVSLLIGELAYGAGSDLDSHVKIGVLLGSGAAALLASVILRIRDRHYRTIREQDTVDDDRDGVPDAFRDDAYRDDEIRDA